MGANKAKVSHICRWYALGDDLRCWKPRSQSQRSWSGYQLSSWSRHEHASVHFSGGIFRHTGHDCDPQDDGTAEDGAGDSTLKFHQFRHTFDALAKAMIWIFQTIPYAMMPKVIRVMNSWDDLSLGSRGRYIKIRLTIQKWLLMLTPLICHCIIFQLVILLHFKCASSGFSWSWHSQGWQRRPLGPAMGALPELKMRRRCAKEHG